MMDPWVHIEIKTGVTPVIIDRLVEVTCSLWAKPDFDGVPFVVPPYGPNAGQNPAQIDPAGHFLDDVAPW